MPPQLRFGGFLLGLVAATAFASDGRRLVNPRAALGLPVGGVTASVHNLFLYFAEQQLLPSLEQELNKLEISDISGSKDSFDYKVSNIKLTSFTAEASLHFLKSVGVQLVLSKIALTGGADWKYKESIWPHEPSGSGSLDLSVSGSSNAVAILDLGVNAAPTQRLCGNGSTPSSAACCANLCPAAANSKNRATCGTKLGMNISGWNQCTDYIGGTPHVGLPQLDVNIDDLSIHVHGSLFSWLYDLIVKAFNGDVKDEIVDAVKSAVKDEVGGNLENLLAGLSLRKSLPLPHPFDIAAIDFQLLRFDITDSNLDMILLGSVNDTRWPEHDVYPGPPPPGTVIVNSTLAKATDVTFLVSPYVLNSALFVYSRSGLLEFAITSDLIPGLTADSLKSLAPGLSKWSGHNISINLSTNQSSLPTARISNRTVIVDSTLLMDFEILGIPENISSAFIVGCPLLAQATAGVSNSGNLSRVTLDVKKLTCTPVSLSRSSVGTVDVSSFDSLIGLVLGILVPRINQVVNQGFSLPSIGDFGIANPALEWGEGVLQVSSNLTFN